MKTYKNPEFLKKFQGENSPTFGIEVSKETREKMRQKKLGIKQSTEHRKKISERMQNNLHPMYRHDISDQIIIDTYSQTRSVKETLLLLKISRTMFYHRKKFMEKNNTWLVV